MSLRREFKVSTFKTYATPLSWLWSNELQPTCTVQSPGDLCASRTALDSVRETLPTDVSHGPRGKRSGYIDWALMLEANFQSIVTKTACAISHPLFSMQTYLPIRLLARCPLTTLMAALSGDIEYLEAVRTRGIQATGSHAANTSIIASASCAVVQCPFFIVPTGFMPNLRAVLQGFNRVTFATALARGERQRIARLAALRAQVYDGTCCPVMTALAQLHSAVVTLKPVRAISSKYSSIIDTTFRLSASMAALTRHVHYTKLAHGRFAGRPVAFRPASLATFAHRTVEIIWMPGFLRLPSLSAPSCAGTIFRAMIWYFLAFVAALTRYIHNFVAILTSRVKAVG
eukprot:scpid62804/ scgid2478/ 